ncbi:Suppressor of GAMMA RESPONSE 1 [Forsythia ovata]|uniref:Suppressor of GAMMA RESPONSE 1 n=1 Tax=Forsythia ovata TaxID=205694 RepID=A0ABD1T6W7_9LAMI
MVADDLKKDLEECQDLVLDPANIELDTPPDFWLSHLSILKSGDVLDYRQSHTAGTEEGQMMGTMRGNFDIEVTYAKISRPSRKKSKKAFWKSAGARAYPVPLR